jgi:hypothetical protein
MEGEHFEKETIHALIFEDMELKKSKIESKSGMKLLKN